MDGNDTMPGHHAAWNGNIRDWDSLLHGLSEATQSPLPVLLCLSLSSFLYLPAQHMLPNSIPSPQNYITCWPRFAINSLLVLLIPQFTSYWSHSDVCGRTKVDYDMHRSALGQLFTPAQIICGLRERGNVTWAPGLCNRVTVRADPGRINSWMRSNCDLRYST